MQEKQASEIKVGDTVLFVPGYSTPQKVTEVTPADGKRIKIEVEDGLQGGLIYAPHWLINTVEGEEE